MPFNISTDLFFSCFVPQKVLPAYHSQRKVGWTNGQNSKSVKAVTLGIKSFRVYSEKNL